MSVRAVRRDEQDPELPDGGVRRSEIFDRMLDFMLCQYYYLCQNDVWLSLLQTKATGIELVNKAGNFG